ncbi:MAG TPA: glycosyltransferase [Candidatus Bathyarchaeia archaeon]|nr:glycosyltransferase [Candidatus Bathyarchaeia archaeon]
MRAIERVLFVSGIDGFCHRYEVLHRAEQLAALGIESTVRHFADPRLLDEAPAHDLLFLYRVPDTRHVGEVIARAREQNRPVVGSIDDLIFVDDRECLPPLDHLEPGERELWLDGVRRYRATLERCDAFVAPTEPLLEEARRLGWKAYLHRESVSAVELALAERALAARGERPPRSAAVRLGYFSGTATHDADFASIAATLVEAMQRHPELRLLVVGPLELDARLAPFARRIDRQPFVPWPELAGLVAAVDVSLAPLVSRERFAAAKGEGKYMEAAAVAVPVIASPTAAFRHATREGETGRLAADADGWLAALEELIRDPRLRERLGAAALADVKQRYSPGPRGRELVEILGQVAEEVARHPARSPRAGGGAGPSAGSPLAARADVPCARFALEPDAFPDVAVAHPDAVSPALGDGSVLVQKLRVVENGVFRVDLHAVTYGQALEHRIELRLVDADGRIAASAHAEAAWAPDRGWLGFAFAPLPASKGVSYTIELRATGTGPGNAISFGLVGATSGPLAGARLDGAELGGALALRVFAEWRAVLGAEPLAPARAAME